MSNTSGAKKVVKKIKKKICKTLKIKIVFRYFEIKYIILYQFKHLI